MHRKLSVLAFSAMVALGSLTAAATPSAAGHRDDVRFGIGIGFGNGYIQFHSTPRYRYKPYHYYDPYTRYHVPVYRKYRPRVVYKKVYYPDAHVRWCYANYRSYRAYDNTFQPYHGGRKQCWSPYD